MKKTKDKKVKILIDIRYENSINKFEEVYGDSMTYPQVEQESYIELKSMVFEKINKNIKFRKHERNGMVLTLRAEMLPSEFGKLLELHENSSFNFVHNFTISNIEILE